MFDHWVTRVVIVGRDLSQQDIVPGSVNYQCQILTRAIVNKRRTLVGGDSYDGLAVVLLLKRFTPLPTRQGR